VLHRAFAAYPVVRYLFENSSAGQRNSFSRMFEALIESRLVRNWPALGALEQDRIAGVALVGAPEDRPSTPAADALFEAAERVIGPEAAGRFHAYAELCTVGLPAWPHHYLGVLGVDPGHRGRHHGRALIAAVQSIAREDPRSNGVVLNTESLSNLPYYEQSGFRVVHEERMDSIVSWTMTWEAEDSRFAAQA